MTAPETCPFCGAGSESVYNNGVREYVCGTMAGMAGSVRRSDNCYARKEAALEREVAVWRLAAARTGLYRSDTDVSTPALWEAAQSGAACALLSERDAALSEVAGLRAELEQAKKDTSLFITVAADAARANIEAQTDLAALAGKEGA